MISIRGAVAAVKQAWREYMCVAHLWTPRLDGGQRTCIRCGAAEPKPADKPRSF